MQACNWQQWKPRSLLFLLCKSFQPNWTATADTLPKSSLAKARNRHFMINTAALLMLSLYAMAWFSPSGPKFKNQLAWLASKKHRSAEACCTLHPYPFSGQQLSEFPSLDVRWCILPKSYLVWCPCHWRLTGGGQEIAFEWWQPMAAKVQVTQSRSMQIFQACLWLQSCQHIV